MRGGAKAHYDGIVAFSQTDFTEDLKQVTVPSLVMHSEDDQVVPYADSGPLSAKLIPDRRRAPVASTHAVESTSKTVRSGYLDPAAKPVAVITPAIRSGTPIPGRTGERGEVRDELRRPHGSRL
jgi:pimeloyl-ACP methyl ester carboxylesterase